MLALRKRQDTTRSCLKSMLWWMLVVLGVGCTTQISPKVTPSQEPAQSGSTTCAGYFNWLFRVGVRRLDWPGVRARQEKRTDSPESISKFYQVYIRFAEAKQPVRLRLPDGTFLRTDEITKELLNQRLGKSLKTVGGEGWVALSVDYEVGNTTFYLDGDEVTGLSINAVAAERSAPEALSGKLLPAIGAVDREEVYPLPITDEQLKMLFGEPTRDEAKFFNT